MAPRSEASSTGADGQQQPQQLMHQQHYQAQIQRLERELAAVRRQASGYADVSVVFWKKYVELKTFIKGA